MTEGLAFQGRVRPARPVIRGRRTGWPGARLVLLLLALLTGCGPDRDQVDLCSRIIPALHDPGVRFEVTDSETDPAEAAGVVVRYRTLGAGGEGHEHWVSCRFAGSGFARDRLELEGVSSDSMGPLSGARLHILKRFWLQDFKTQGREGGAAGAGGRGWRFHLLFALQQVINGLVVCCVYALLALGYSLAYGIVGRINLAFGEIAMMGAFTAVMFVLVAVAAGETALAAAIALILVLTVVLGAGQGLGLARSIFTPLAGVPGQAALIATLGLAVALQEYVRLVQGARERWLQPVFATPIHLAGDGTFSVSVSSGQLLTVGLTAVLCLGLWVIFARTAFGRAYRACADDPGMAALLGVPVGRVVNLSFALGAGFAAAAGFVIAVHYGGVNFYMGTLLGFKALTAAILGGIGVPAGAVLGGALIGLLETEWSAYLPLAYRDVAVFAVLALVLIFRPQGLLGVEPRRDR